MSQIKKIGTRMEITPKSERLGGVLPAEAGDEAINLNQLKGFGLTKPSRKYTATISQSGTSAPTVTVLENTIGAIVWTYGGTGYYLATLTGAFPTQSKVFLNSPNFYGGAGDITLPQFGFFWNNANSLILTSRNGGTDADDLLNNTSIEIRIYN